MSMWVASHTGLPSFHVKGSWQVVGVLDGVERLVAAGSGAAVFSDAAAPVNEPVEYVVTDSTGTSRGQLTRAGSHARFITDMWGRSVVPIIWQGDDALSLAQSAEVFTTSGSNFPIVRFNKPAITTGAITLRTSLDGTPTLSRLVRSGSPLWLVHDRTACQIPGCDVDPVRLIAITSETSYKRTARPDTAERVWQFTYHLLNPASHSKSPTVTYREARQADFKFGSGSYLDAAKKIAGMP